MNLKLYDYLKHDTFNSLRKELEKKYINYGSCIGTITLIPKTEEEVNELSGFLSCNIYINKPNKIKIMNIQKCLDDSPFAGTKVDDIVLMFNPNIKSHKEIKNENNLFISKSLIDYHELYDNSNIQKLFENNEALKKIKYYVSHDKKLIDNILKALNSLPVYTNDFKQLAIFSTNTVSNPHYFDLDGVPSNILIQFICYLMDIEYDSDRKSKIDVLEKVGIYVDSVSNNVITYNLIGNDMVDSFKNSYEPLTINLSNLSKMDNIKAMNNNVLIVENPSFLSKVIGKKLNYSIIVTSGNPNMVVYKLLEKLKYSNIYYNGDYDPEGLLIAQKLLCFIPKIKLIGYNNKYYQNGISSNVVNQMRLRKLDNVNNPNLEEIKKLILNKKCASYQEANYDMLIEDINLLCG